VSALTKTGSKNRDSVFVLQLFILDDACESP